MIFLHSNRSSITIKMPKGTPVPGRVRYTQSKLEFLRKLRDLLKSSVCECASHGAFHKWGNQNDISLHPKLTAALENSGLINISSRGTVWASTVEPNMKTVEALDKLLSTLDAAGHVDGHRKNKSKKATLATLRDSALESAKLLAVASTPPASPVLVVNENYEERMQRLLKELEDGRFVPAPPDNSDSVQMSYPKGSSVEYNVGADRPIVLEFNGTTITLKGCLLKISF